MDRVTKDYKSDHLKKIEKKPIAGLTNFFITGSHSYKYLGKMILATTSCHPRIHPLCYEVAERVVKDDFDTFKKFWKEAVDGGLLESTPERKYLALKLAVHSFSLLNESQVTNHIILLTEY